MSQDQTKSNNKKKKKCGFGKYLEKEDKKVSIIFF